MNLCIIPARGGSKRIPKKNIKLFCNKPLIAYSIELAKKSNLFNKIVVSTDDEDIATISKKYGAEILKRPKHLADDFSSSMDVFEHAINQLNKDNRFSFACMLYPTSPLLEVKYLKKGLEELKKNDVCYTFLATKFEHPIERGFEIINNRAKMLFPEAFNKRTQDLKEVYHDGGSFYWKKLSCKEKFTFEGNIPIIAPKYLAIDIDTLEDFKMAELICKGLQKEEKMKRSNLKNNI